jgi:glutathione synthase/RimK-type ligase-like ATP-grasp enzyme
MQADLQKIAERAYLALGGNGYGRVDMRTDESDNQTMVLEVNANCGVSFNPQEFTSTTGEILRMSGVSVRQFAWDLIEFALERRRRRNNLCKQEHL